MKPLWYQHLKDKQEQEQFQTLVLGSQKVLDRLREICYNGLNSAEKVKVEDYDVPSWSHKQAHKNGRLEVYRELLALLDFSN